LAEIQNPNQGGGGGGGLGGDSKSLFGFMIVFVLMVVAFQVFGPKKTQQPQPSQQKAQTTQSAPALAAAAGEGSAAAPATPAGNVSTAATNAVQAASESETVVENEVYRITFTNRGGAVKSWLLNNKQYKDDRRTSSIWSTTMRRRSMDCRYRCLPTMRL
jgi:YidC/Oxa1 family membrane protein insertase